MNLKKISSIFVALAFVMGCVLPFGSVAKGVASTKLSASLTVASKTILVGEKPTYTVKAKGASLIQYKLFLYNYNTKKTVELTKGYSGFIASTKTYSVTPNYSYQSGKYKITAWARSSGSKKTNDVAASIILTVSKKAIAVKPEVAWESAYYNTSMKGKKLGLYGVTDIVRPILDEFEKDTGIKVENLTLKNGEILERLKNEKASGKNIADLWFTGGADTFIAASQKNLLIPYISPASKVLDSESKDKNGYWTGTSVTIVNWVVNTKLIKEKGLKMPETWEDLLQAGLKGEVSMPNPASSGTAFNVVSAMLRVKGEAKGWEYLQNLAGQVPFFTARGSDPANNVINGEAIVGINAGEGDSLLEKNPNIKIIYPTDGTGWWPQPVAIVKGTTHLAEAKVFIDWILSKRGMESITRLRNAAVVRDDVKRPAGIISIKSIKLFKTDFQADAEQRDAILAQWKKRINR
jgi:iron(III) transport system substrate-binding protein